MPPPDAPPAAPIVVADSLDGFDLLRPWLEGEFGLAAAHTLEQACRLVTTETPLVLCGVHFDDGRMYDLLTYLKGRPALAAVPFLAVRLRPGELDDAIYQSVKIAVTALGGDGFLDLFRWQSRHGEQEGAFRLVDQVRRLATGLPPEDTQQ